MDLANLIVNPSWVSYGAGLLALFGLFLWLLVRKRQKRVWLPTVRIIRLETRLLPRLVLTPPPLLAFLCFLVCALVMVGFTLKPRREVFTPFEPDRTRVHVFVDLSPSVSAHASAEEIASQVETLFASLKDSGRVTVSTSHDATIHEPQDPLTLRELITSLGFHRAGLRLGSALKTQMERIGDVDRLFLVTDRDQHSWSGFNWPYLLDEMDIVFVDVETGKGRGGNAFVNQARYLSTPASLTMDWDVEILRRGGKGELQGEVVATLGDKTLGTFPFKMPEDRQSLTLRASWPVTLVEELAASPADSGPIVWKISTSSGDVLALDDEFRTPLMGVKQDVLLVSAAAGERVLEDPVHQLTIALEVLGFKIKRHDFLEQPGPSPERHPFMILVGGQGEGVDRFCPRSIQLARQSSKGGQGAKDGGRRSFPKVWLVPHATHADYRELCLCHHRLLASDSGTVPVYCEDLSARNQWMGLLPSLGAKQIGGRVGDPTGAIAWHSRDDETGLEVLAFTTPLTPRLETGITHALLPVLVKELLSWQGILQESGPTGAGWPRIDDIAADLWRPADAPAAEPAEMARKRLSNVPLGESLRMPVEPAELPPRWTSQMDWSKKGLPAKKDREDPLPWLRFGALAIVFFCALEALWLLAASVLKLLTTKPGRAAGLVLALLGAGALTDPAEATVSLTVLGPRTSLFSLAGLAREVSHRTSIELDPEPRAFATFEGAALSEPWLWTRDLSSLLGKNGALSPDAVTWIKRGGFLVIEAPLAEQNLERLVSAFASYPDTGWQAIPPDHEIMRSFYLLDALPSCSAEVWRGFQFDGRLAILAIPYRFLDAFREDGGISGCANPPSYERSVRVFVNLIMVSLATDYKKDQIHLPEILKRLR